MFDDSTALPPSSPNPPNSLTQTPRRRSPIEPREHREPRHERQRGARHSGSSARCVALIDAQFWSWLKDSGPDDSTGLPTTLRGDLEHLLAQADQAAQLVRIVWYTDDTSAAGRHLPGVAVRLVPSNADDGGVGMLRSMAQEMTQLALRGGADRVLLASDDERLLLAVDEAQRAGLAVDMVVDDQSLDLAELHKDDPQWARLLMTADRQIVLGDTPSGRDASGRDRARDGRSAPSSHAAQVIDEEIRSWWAEETTAQREHWRYELQATRGIPQELDRQLLLRISRRLGQALTPPEKNAMRAQARQCIQADGDDRPAGSDAAPIPQPATE